MDCLVTKLKGTVNDNSLLKLGEIRIKKEKVSSSWNTCTQGFRLCFNENTTISIIGNGYFTDLNGTADKGKTLYFTKDVQQNVYVSNDDMEISIPNKYALTYLNLRQPENVSVNENTNDQKSKSIVGGLENLKYSPLTRISAANTSITGDISALSGKSLTVASFSYTAVTGDISVFNGMNLEALELQSTEVTGDLSNLVSSTNMKYLIIADSNIYGDISNLKDMAALIGCLMPENVSGDISTLANCLNIETLSAHGQEIIGNVDSLKNLSKLTTLSLYGSNVSGDLSLLPASLYFYSDKASGDYPGYHNKFTWKNTRPSSAKILAMESVDLGDDLDAMLINQANCIAGPSNPTYRMMYVKGKKTSASDAAVLSLQEKGYTVVVTNTSD